MSHRRVQKKKKATSYCIPVRSLVMVREPVASARGYNRTTFVSDNFSLDTRMIEKVISGVQVT